MHTFGRKLQELRQAAGLSQAQLAERSGVPVQTVRGYEQDFRAPTWRPFLELCTALGADPMAFRGCAEGREKTS